MNSLMSGSSRLQPMMGHGNFNTEGGLPVDYFAAPQHVQNGTHLGSRIETEEILQMRLAVAMNKAVQHQQQAAFMQHHAAMATQPQHIHINSANPNQLKHVLPGSGFLPAELGTTLRLAAAGVGVPQDELPAKSKRMGQTTSKSRSHNTLSSTNGTKSNGSLRAVLSELRNEDPKCVFITRQIKELGFRAKDLLREYFSQFGEVSQVLIPHTKVKPGRNSGSRSRPGNFGLVQMVSPLVVQRIFAVGSMHAIKGVKIAVHVFELPTRTEDMEPDEAEDKGEEDKGEEGKCEDSRETEDKARQTPPHSTSNDDDRTPSQDEHEVGYSRSGGCTDGQQSSSNGQEQSISPRGERVNSAGECAPAPMSVGDWRQLRLDAGKSCLQATSTSEQQEATTGIEIVKMTGAVRNPEPPEVAEMRILNALMKSNENPERPGVAEIGQSLVSLAKASPQESAEQREGCQGHLSQCLLAAAHLLIADAHALQAKADACRQEAGTAEDLQTPALPPSQANSSPEARSALVNAVSQEMTRIASMQMHDAPYGMVDPSLQPAWPPGLAMGRSAATAPVAADLAKHIEAQHQFNAAHIAGAGCPWPPGQFPGMPMQTLLPGYVPGYINPDIAAAGGFASPDPIRIPIVPQVHADAGAAHAEEKTPMLTLRSHLKEVSTEDPACIFVVRRIHTLGFHSHRRLREHFSQHGQVLKVLVAHRKLKALPDSSGQLGLPRKRPGSLGLVLMKNAGSVTKIIGMGHEQTVGGYQIQVEAFSPSLKNDNDHFTATDEASTTAESSGPNSDYRVPNSASLGVPIPEFEPQYVDTFSF